MHVPVRTWHTDATSRRAVKRDAGYFVASFRLKLLVSDVIPDFYKACQFGNFLQERIDFATVALKTVADAAALKAEIARYKSEFDALQ